MYFVGTWPEIDEVFEENKWLKVLVRSNCTDHMQPLDLQSTEGPAERKLLAVVCTRSVQAAIARQETRRCRSI